MTGCGNGGFHVCADIGSFVTLHEILEQSQVAGNEPESLVQHLYGDKAARTEAETSLGSNFIKKNLPHHWTKQHIFIRYPTFE